MQNDELNAILADVRACETVILATCGETYPDARHILNVLNANAVDFNLKFITTMNSPKHMQMAKNPWCALYYFNPENRHAVRLYGTMEFITAPAQRRAQWRDEFTAFGFTGADDPKFTLMRFIGDSYKFYIGNDMHTGALK